jgi:hypothetical protein
VFCFHFAFCKTPTQTDHDNKNNEKFQLEVVGVIISSHHICLTQLNERQRSIREILGIFIRETSKRSKEHPLNPATYTPTPYL